MRRVSDDLKMLRGTRGDMGPLWELRPRAPEPGRSCSTRSSTGEVRRVEFREVRPVQPVLRLGVRALAPLFSVGLAMSNDREVQLLEVDPEPHLAIFATVPSPKFVQ